MYLVPVVSLVEAEPDTKYLMGCGLIVSRQPASPVSPAVSRWCCRCATLNYHRDGRIHQGHICCVSSALRVLHDPCGGVVVLWYSAVFCVLRFKKGFWVCVRKGFLGVWFWRRFRVVHVVQIGVADVPRSLQS